MLYHLIPIITQGEGGSDGEADDDEGGVTVSGMIEANTYGEFTTRQALF